MIKKNQLLFVAVWLLTTVNAFALQVGDIATRLDIDRWMKNGPASILLTPSEDKSIMPCTVVTFWGSWNPSLNSDISVLNYLQKRFKQKGLQIIAISREPAPVIENCLKKFTIKYAVGVDRESRTTLQYMRNDHVFPKAFLVDQPRNIIWKGEIADLENILSKYFKGTFDVEQQQIIDKLHDKLRLALRSLNGAEAEKIITNILEYDPVDGFAIRAALFVYAKSNRPAAALKFIDKRIASAPENIKFRLIKLGLMQQYTPEKTTAVNRFAQTTVEDFKSRPIALNELAWFLLTNFQFTPDIILTALDSAKKASRSIVNSHDTEQKILINTTLARALCIVGKPRQALKIQEKITSMVIDPEQKKQSLRNEKYYRQLVNLPDSK